MEFCCEYVVVWFEEFDFVLGVLYDVVVVELVYY